MIDGNTAVAPAAATPPAVPAAVPGAAATPASGFLDSIKLPDRSPADAQTAPQAPAPAPDATPGQTPKDGEPAASTPTFKATIKGREYTGEDLVKAYEASTTEGMKIPALTDNLKRATAEAVALRAKIQEFELKAIETPPFKVLTKDELKELDPADQTEYIIRKAMWEKDKDERKVALTEMQERRAAQDAEIKAHVYSRTQEMFNDPVKYPMYKELVPVMESLLDKVPQLAGQKDTPDFLYYAAWGLHKLKEETVSRTESEKARQEAADKAKADAAAAGPGGSPAPVLTASTDDDSDEAFNKRILEAHQKSVVRL